MWWSDFSLLAFSRENNKNEEEEEEHGKNNKKGGGGKTIKMKLHFIHEIKTIAYNVT